MIGKNSSEMHATAAGDAFGGRCLVIEMSAALLFTDSQDKNLSLQRKIGQILPCKVAPLHDTLVENTRADVIVSDVSLDSPVVTEMLRLVLDRYREEGIPILFLLHNVTSRSVRSALNLGANKILDAECPQGRLVEALSALLGAKVAGHQGKAMPETPTGIEAWVSNVNTIFTAAMDAAREGCPIAPESITAGADSVLAAIHSHSLRLWLEVVWSYDDTTYQHCLLVAGLAAAFALKLGFSRRDCQRLTGAALLHDIGKVRIPKEILTKLGRLTDAEMDIMRTHPVIGADLLRSQGGFSDDVISVVRHHHEYLDGTGYPDRLRGKEIGDLVRITTICDIQAALIERRPYKESMSMMTAFLTLADMKGKLDPALVNAFEVVACDI